MKMVKGCGKMPSKVRLEKNCGTSVDEKAIYYKILHFVGKFGKFPVLSLNSLCFPCLEKVITKFPVFPVPWPPWHISQSW